MLNPLAPKYRPDIFALLRDIAEKREAETDSRNLATSQARAVSSGQRPFLPGPVHSPVRPPTATHSPVVV